MSVGDITTDFQVISSLNNNEHSFIFFSNFHLDYIGGVWAGKALGSHSHLSVNKFIHLMQNRVTTH